MSVDLVSFIHVGNERLSEFKEPAMSILRRKSRFVIAVAVPGVLACICVSLASDKKREKELGISDRFHYETSLTW